MNGVKAGLVIPTKGFLTNGVGFHSKELNSFELALRDAGIHNYNLVRVSSIKPHGLQLVSKEEGIRILRDYEEESDGAVIYTVMSRIYTDEPSRLVAAAVGLAIPTDREKYGYVSEIHNYGMNAKEIGDLAEDTAAEMLATVNGYPFDPDRSYDENRDEYNLSGVITKTRSQVQSAQGRKQPDGSRQYVTCLAAVVFCEYKEVRRKQNS